MSAQLRVGRRRKEERRNDQVNVQRGQWAVSGHQVKQCEHKRRAIKARWWWWWWWSRNAKAWLEQAGRLLDECHPHVFSCWSLVASYVFSTGNCRRVCKSRGEFNRWEPAKLDKAITHTHTHTQDESEPKREWKLACDFDEATAFRPN